MNPSNLGSREPDPRIGPAPDGQGLTWPRVQAGAAQAAPAPGGRQVQASRLAPASGTGRHVEVKRVPHAAAAVTFSSGSAAGPQTPTRQDSTTGVEKGGGAERQDWVRQLLDGLWPYTRDAAQKVAWELIPPTLDASRPPFVSNLAADTAAALLLITVAVSAAADTTGCRPWLAPLPLCSLPSTATIHKPPTLHNLACGFIVMVK